MILPQAEGKEFEEWAADLVRILTAEINALQQRINEIEARVEALENP